MKNLSIRNVPLDLSNALEAKKYNLNLSLNATVLYLLQHALGLSTEPKKMSNGLANLAGQWDQEDYAEFVANTRNVENAEDEKS